ncbi:MAG: acyl-CoA dehydratase activase-related protein [Defluviitaleaceae bacterium]|nr:acyl-CoA dehydratase activase-related protein [Defluviitaleaceae bacterium]
MQKIKIGIPKALLYFKYRVMWLSFFDALGCDVVVSPDTNKAILDMGVNSSIDESCTSAKIYSGHVEWLIKYGKCDYIFVPRVVSYPDGDITCTKFHGLYDICRATFPNVKWLHYNIDYAEKHTTWQAYKKLGTGLGAKPDVVSEAYHNAIKALHNYEADLQRKQEEVLKKDGLKVLIVAHPYNIYDKVIGEPIVKTLQELGVNVLYADVPDTDAMCARSEALSTSVYWRYNKELIGAVDMYKYDVDGIIFLATFPCGPDSLAIELLVRKIKDIPRTTLIADSNFGEAGIQTRIESFIDILEAKKKGAMSGNGAI